MDLPNLIGIQTDNFEWFRTEGIAQAFKDIGPIESNAKDMTLEYVSHYFEDPVYTVDECKEKDVTYEAKLNVVFKFTNHNTGVQKETTVFLGDHPVMTPRGTFIINGTERVVVSQLVRSPGVYFSQERDKTSDKTIYSAKIIPSRGAWLEFETDKRDILSVRIDRKRKQPATLLIRALDLAETNEEIIELLGDSEMIRRTLERDPATTREESLIELYKRFRPGEPPTVDSARTLLEGLFFNPQRYDLAKVGRYKMDKKLDEDPAENDSSTLTNEDIVRTMKYIIALHDGVEGYHSDDIDHFGNRRIRTVGELIQNQFRIGVSRMERVVRERGHVPSRKATTSIPTNSSTSARSPRRSRNSTALRSCRSSWTRRTPRRASPTSAACRPWAPAAFRASAQASRFATFTPPTATVRRSEHRAEGLRSDRLVVFVHPHRRRHRLHREPLPPRRRRKGHRRGGLPHGRRGRELRHRAGQRHVRPRHPRVRKLRQGRQVGSCRASASAARRTPTASSARSLTRSTPCWSTTWTFPRAR